MNVRVHKENLIKIWRWREFEPWVYCVSFELFNQDFETVRGPDFILMNPSHCYSCAIGLSPMSTQRRCPSEGKNEETREGSSSSREFSLCSPSFLCHARVISLCVRACALGWLCLCYVWIWAILSCLCWCVAILVAVGKLRTVAKMNQPTSTSGSLCAYIWFCTLSLRSSRSLRWFFHLRSRFWFKMPIFQGTKPFAISVKTEKREEKVFHWKKKRRCRLPNSFPMFFVTWRNM